EQLQQSMLDDEIPGVQTLDRTACAVRFRNVENSVRPRPMRAIDQFGHQLATDLRRFGGGLRVGQPRRDVVETQGVRRGGHQAANSCKIAVQKRDRLSSQPKAAETVKQRWPTEMDLFEEPQPRHKVSK